MKNKAIILILLFLLNGFASSKNLSILKKVDMLNSELLDIYIHGDHAYIPGGLGGLNILDISNPNDVSVLGNYYATNCAWGRLYTWSVHDNYAYGTGRECGIEIINISNKSNPYFVWNIGSTGIRYEHSEVHNNYLYTARHQAGVEIFSLAEPAYPNSINVINTHNAWAVLPFAHYLYVADGSQGIKIFNIGNPQSVSEVASALTTGSARDLAIKDNYLFVAVGSKGVDMFDISDPEQPLLISNYNTTGFATRISSNDSLVVVSDWDDIEVLGFTSGELKLKGFKNTGGRSMAIAIKDDIIFSAEWFDFYIFKYGQIQGPDIDFSDRKIEFSRTKSGEEKTQSFFISNNGAADLNITNIDYLNADFTIALDKTIINPGETIETVVTYSPNYSWSDNLIIHSNDEDESAESIRLQGNFLYGPMPGDPAPDFTLPGISIETNYVSLKSLKGNPSVIAFFTAW